MVAGSLTWLGRRPDHSLVGIGVESDVAHGEEERGEGRGGGGVEETVEVVRFRPVK